MKAKFFAALAFILSAQATATTIETPPGFGFSEVRFEAEAITFPFNVAFTISPEANHFLLRPLPEFRLFLLGIEDEGENLFLNVLIGNLLGFEGDTQRVGDGWLTSSIGSVFVFPFHQLRFTSAEVAPYVAPIAAPVPEPTSLALLGVGLLGLWGAHKWHPMIISRASLSQYLKPEKRPAKPVNAPQV